MAFIKPLITEQNTEVQYWRIIAINQEYHDDGETVGVAMVGYVNEVSRRPPISAKWIEYRYLHLDSRYLDKIYENGNDTMRNIGKKEAYNVIKASAIKEREKPTAERNTELEWFWDADGKA